MKIEVVREACCSQDDQLGPLSIEVDIPERAMVWELAREIGEADFLQFSGTHRNIDVYCAGKHLFSIPAVGIEGGRVEYIVGRNDMASNYLRENRVQCIWPPGS